MCGVEGHAAACSCGLCDDDPEKAEANIAYGVPNGGVGDALVGGKIWGGKTVSYGFPTDAAVYDLNLATPGVQYGSGEPADGFAPLSEIQITTAEAALGAIAAVSGLSITRADSNADIRVAQSNGPTSAWAYLPDDHAKAGDVWFGREPGYFDAPERGGYTWHAFLHEMGHAVGLKHGHEHAALGAGGALASERDSMEWSVMTYRSYIGDQMQNGYSNESGGYAQSLMRADIAALQQLYGPNYDHRSGDTTYEWRPETGEMFVDGQGRGAPVSNRVFETIWDGGGVDVIDASAYRTSVEIDLAPGGGAVLAAGQRAWLNRMDAGEQTIFASANVYFANLHKGDVRAMIENAIGGSAGDVLAGNGAANRLLGGDGDDDLFGFRGKDTLFGGAGHDTAQGGSGGDRLIGQTGDDHLAGGGGRDYLGGGGGRDRLEGGAGRDRLIGGGGADEIFGGRGADDLTGGGGADIFHFSANNGADKITDFGLGNDRLSLVGLVETFSDLQILNVAVGVKINFHSGQIILTDVQLSEFSASDFLF